MLSSDDTPPAKPRSRLFLIVCSLLVMVGFILILVEVGKWTRERVSHLDRYTISFPDIECRRPPAQDQGQFLSEVQYLGDLPDQLHLLDADLAERLADAFARHPWVEKVEEVKIVPPKQIHVRLVFRTPVLLVVPPSGGGGRNPPKGGTTNSVGSYVVDGQGILLRGSIQAKDLPHFDVGTAPSGPAGTPWGDADVEAAARTAGFLQPYRDQLQVQVIEGRADDLILKGRFAGRILWGRSPGAELPGEASADQKVHRLLDFRSLHGGLGSREKPCEHDVRPKQQALHRWQASRPVEF
jgi:hypothetical protein